MVGLVVQVMAILILIPLKMGSPINTLISYYKIIAVNYAQNGVHLPAQFPSGSILGISLVVIIWVVTIFWLVRKFYLLKRGEAIGDLFDLNLITLAVFLTTYHRIHDIPFMIFFLLILIIASVTLKKFPLNQKSMLILLLSSLLIILLLVFPTISIGLSNTIPYSWRNPDVTTSLALCLMFVLSIWLQAKLPFSNDHVVIE